VIAAAGPVFRIVIYEGLGSEPLPSETRFSITKLLLEKGYAVTATRSGGQVSGIESGVLLVLGKFTETKPAFAEDADGAIKLFFRDIDAMDATAVLTLVDATREQAQIAKPGGWKPWFPVIDFGRCTNCMQCLSFCLFNVYGVTKEGKITVQYENHCKTDCPACSRVCPEVAILFPKYRNGPINGDEISSDDLRREAMKVDISSLLGGDIYQALRDRSAKAKSRFSKERDEDRALKERMRCLQKLSDQMDIPPEVFASLPSIDQIQQKAREAQARADEALKLAAQQTNS
jgi:Pyruvate/2-oxoacid:ferredoxin oxidoreductase delta subunit